MIKIMRFMIKISMIKIRIITYSTIKILLMHKINLNQMLN